MIIIIICIILVIIIVVIIAIVISVIIAVIHISMKLWNDRCANEEEIIRKCEQDWEFCEMRDRRRPSILNKEESYTIIKFLCT